MCVVLLSFKYLIIFLYESALVVKCFIFLLENLKKKYKDLIKLIKLVYNLIKLIVQL